MEQTQSVREIINLEDAYWRAIQEQDIDAALELTDERCMVSGAQGYANIDRDELAQMLKGEQWQLRRYELIGEPAVRFLSPDVAVVAYKLKEDMKVEGKPLTLEASEASTWVRRDGKWRCALHTESLSGDPFGRDRVSRAPTDEPLAAQDAAANLAVKDLAKARRFYEETLGLRPLHEEAGELVVYQSGNTTLNVYRSDYAGTNKATALTWMVGDLEKAVKRLRSKGVTFEHYDMPDMRLEGDIHVSPGMKIAWFKDLDGNILSLIHPEETH
ncbi:DUF4440 domain-containing protein [Myxococcaceae bacterium GXIMD 01537]